MTKVGIISDACLGFGSPQIIALAEALKEAMDAEVTIVEPDVPTSPPQHASFPQFRIVRQKNRKHVYDAGGRVEYCKRAAAVMNELRPDLLVVVCTFCMPALLYLKARPRFTVFYSIESIIQYGEADVILNQHLRSKIDFIIWPEENRQALDQARSGLGAIPNALVLNSANPRQSAEEIAPAAQRLRRIIHQGTIGQYHTYSHWFLKPSIRRLPLDIYGPLVDEGSKAMLAFAPGMEQADPTGLLYHGRVDLVRLARARRTCAYSVCIWNPAEERGRFAPSNKFFESVADAVPPITAPHPQHVRLVEKYDCGIVMEDWSLSELRRTLLVGLRLFGTPRYQELVENCRRAVREELNADDQFGRVALEIAQRARALPAAA